MVDLSTCETVMRKQQKARRYIDPDAFNLARRKAGLTVQMAAIELDVNERTIRNYENGAVRIPYSAFRVMRLLAGYPLIGNSKQLKNNWDNWSFWQNKLWSPNGRSFEAHELLYVSTYIGLARHFLKTQSVASLQRNSTAAAKVLAVSPVVNERPSSATALFGVKVAQESPSESETLLACIEKAA